MFRIGVDVGGTNTDAVVMEQRTVRAVVKVPTTPDVMDGLMQALGQVLEAAALAPDRGGPRGHRHDAVHQCRHRAPSSRPRPRSCGLPCRRTAACRRWSTGPRICARRSASMSSKPPAASISMARPLPRWRPRRSPASAATSARAASARSPWWAYSRRCATMPSARPRAYSPSTAPGRRSPARPTSASSDFSSVRAPAS